MHKQEYREVLLSDIKVSKTNPRLTFDEKALNELADSIRSTGLQHPITLRQIPNKKKDPPKFELVAGERRYRAFLKLAIESDDYAKIPAMIRELTDEQAMQVQFVENTQRQDVHPMEEAIAYQNYMLRTNVDVAEIALQVGKSITYIRTRLRLCGLIEQLQRPFYEGKFTLKTATLLASLSTTAQEKIFDTEIDDVNDLTEENQYFLQEWEINQISGSLKDAPFDTSDVKIYPEAGACTGCQFNSSVGSLFPDLEKEPRCLNIECYNRKQDIAFDIRVREAMNMKDVVLCAGYRNNKDDETIKFLISGGADILSDGQYLIVDEPEANDRNYYKGDNDDPADDEKDYQEGLREWETEMKEYRDGISTGKFLRAFMVSGSQKGKFLYIEPRTATKITKENVGKMTAADRKLQIAGLKQELEKLDDFMATEEKVIKAAKYRELVQGIDIKGHMTMTRNNSFFEEELHLMLWLMLSEMDPDILEIIGEVFGYPNNWNIDSEIGNYIEKIQNEPNAYNMVQRAWMLARMSEMIGSSNEFADETMLTLLDYEYPVKMEGYRASIIAAINKKQRLTDSKKATIQSQIEALEAEAPKPAKGKGKGIKALLTDKPEGGDEC